MRQPSKLHILLVLVASLTLFFSVAIVVAQAEVNLLENPGFEGTYRVVTGQPDRMVAVGWNPWHIPRSANMRTFENAQPEYEETAPDTSRIRTGNNAQKYFNTFFTHDGGVFQRVTGVTPGMELRFSVYARVWSSTLENVDVSENPGDVLVSVGIDPTGGTDGASPNIIWSVPVEQYDDYRQYSIIATATSNAVTVFVHSQIGFPQQNNFIFLDDAVLAATTDSTIPAETEQALPTDTPVPQPTNTPVPQPTNTPIPQATNTALPQPTDADVGIILPTNTPVPIATNTPAPLPTQTTVPTNTPIPLPTLTPITLPVDETSSDATPTREGDTGSVVEPVPVNTATPLPTNTPQPVGVGGPITSPFPGTIIHTVRKGDVIIELAQLYGSTIAAIYEANDLGPDDYIFVGDELIIPVPLAAPATSTPTPTIVPPVGQDFGTGGATVATYLVQPGDTLSSVARRYNTTVADLARLNGIVNVNLIRAGQQLIVTDAGTGGVSQPPPSPSQPPASQSTYTVQPGDNLYRISLRFGVSLLRLAEVNGIANVNRIFIGQVLTIP
jgi:LysM repeat protein